MEETTASNQRPPRSRLVGPGEIDCHVLDMTATVAADVPLAELQQALARHGQWLPIDGDSTRPVGQLVCCDSTGPLRLGYGAWRDLLLGVQFTNGRGELITAGGRTVKNVAGYDLTKFMVGQRHVFGELATITTRTYRRPSGAILARHAPDPEVVGRLIPTSLRPHWSLLTREALFCGYLGDEAALAFYRSALARSDPIESIDRPLEQDERHRAELWNREGPVVFRASVPPARLGEVAERLGGEWSADAAFGIITAPLAAESDAEAVRKLVHELGGSLRLYRGVAGPAIELSTTPAERQIIERLKLAFDPDHQLNPLPWSTS